MGYDDKLRVRCRSSDRYKFGELANRFQFDTHGEFLDYLLRFIEENESQFRTFAQREPADDNLTRKRRSRDN